MGLFGFRKKDYSDIYSKYYDSNIRNNIELQNSFKNDLSNLYKIKTSEERYVAEEWLIRYFLFNILDEYTSNKFIDNIKKDDEYTGLNRFSDWLLYLFGIDKIFDNSNTFMMFVKNDKFNFLVESGFGLNCFESIYDVYSNNPFDERYVLDDKSIIYDINLYNYHESNIEKIIYLDVKNQYTGYRPNIYDKNGQKRSITRIESDYDIY